MTAALLGLLPVFLVIGIGWGARAGGFVPAEHWAGLSRVTYWLLFPATLFTVIAKADFSGIATGRFLAAAATGFLAMGLLALALRPLLRGVDGPSYTSLFQAATRWNGFVLLAAAPGLFGAQGAALAALIFAPLVPLVNVMCVGVLSVWGEGQAPSARRFLVRLATNPLILGSTAGAVWAGLALPTGGPAFAALDLLARAGLATALLGVGAGLDLKSLAAQPRLLALAVVLKMDVMPVVVFAAAKLFALSPLATAVLAASAATPGAAASYVLAREMGGNAPLTAGHITATTLLALVVMPVSLAAIGWSGPTPA